VQAKPFNKSQVLTYSVRDMHRQELMLTMPTFSKVDPSAYINLIMNYVNLFTEGLSFGFGVYDIADKGQLFIQPYSSDHAPLPGVGRQYLVRLSYSLEFK
jgi:hypothetical protein